MTWKLEDTRSPRNSSNNNHNKPLVKYLLDTSNTPVIVIMMMIVTVKDGTVLPRTDECSELLTYINKVNLLNNPVGCMLLISTFYRWKKRILEKMIDLFHVGSKMGSAISSYDKKTEVTQCKNCRTRTGEQGKKASNRETSTHE